MQSDLILAITGSIITLVGGSWALYNRVEAEKESNNFQDKILDLNDEIKRLQFKTINQLNGEDFPLLSSEITFSKSCSFVKFTVTNLKPKPIFDVKIYYVDSFSESCFKMVVEHISYNPQPSPEEVDKQQEKFLTNFQKRYEYVSIVPGEIITLEIIKMDQKIPLYESQYKIDIIWRNGGTYQYFILFRNVSSAPEKEGDRAKETWEIVEEYYLYEGKRFGKTEFTNFIK